MVMACHDFSVRHQAAGAQVPAVTVNVFILEIEMAQGRAKPRSRFRTILSLKKCLRVFE
jgi:hypothetical protein